MHYEIDLSSVERDVERLLATHGTQPSRPISLASIEVPRNELAMKTLQFAHTEMDPVMFNHCNRVFYLGGVLAKTQFTDWKWADSLSEVFYHTALLHDIGVAPRFHTSTTMSFEFCGAIQAREHLIASGAPQTLADEVTEAIVRHTNFVPGQIRRPGSLIQFATTLDVIGANPQLYHPEFIEEVVQAYPRMNFNNHFADFDGIGDVLQAGLSYDFTSFYRICTSYPQ